MKGLILLFSILVFVTTFPNGTTQVIGSGLVPSSTNSIIRFYGESFIRYDFRDLPREMLLPANKESMSLQFLTGDDEGLIWELLGSNGKKMHLSIQENGALKFVIHDGTRTPQQVIIPRPGGGTFSNRQWYTFNVTKEGRNLKFLINNQYATEVTANSDIQFVSQGDFFLGGSQDTARNTANLVRTNFDGGVTDVEVRKLTSPLRELIISFLQYVNLAEQSGDITIIDRNKIGDYDWYPIVTTPAPVLPTPVTFTNAGTVLVLSEALDMRSNGKSFNFRFRTLEPRGVLAIARGSAQDSRFLAIEIFDGIVHFLYDFGIATNRRVFGERRVDDGEWHEVKVMVENNRLKVSLDGHDQAIPLQSQQLASMYYSKLYIGGFGGTSDSLPWMMYARTGYRGCLEMMQVNGIGVDLYARFRDQNVRGVQIGCRNQAKFCTTQPCLTGACMDRMDDYTCQCPDTEYTGKDCDQNAPALSMDGTKSAEYYFVNTELTHTNDMSIRFNTPLKDGILFSTESKGNGDFIRAELEGGKVKVTMRVNNIEKVVRAGDNLNDYQWHTLFIRRRADELRIQIDEGDELARVIGGEGYKFQIDNVKFGSLGDFSTNNNYIGLMQNFRYEDKDVFSEMKRTTSQLPWIIGINPSNPQVPVYKPITVTSSSTHFQLPGMHVSRTMKILFKFRTRANNGLILYTKGRGPDALAVELYNEKIRVNYNMGNRNQFEILPTGSLNDNNWHTVLLNFDDQGKFSAKIDNGRDINLPTYGDRRLDLQGNVVYIAGLPENMFRQPDVSDFIGSEEGYRGCLASVDLNGAVPELLKDYANDKDVVKAGCSELTVECVPGACGPGVCIPRVNDFICDCNLTGFAGVPCESNPVGYYFGKTDGKGVIVYEFPQTKIFDSDRDEVAFGFKSWLPNGILYRAESAFGNEFIEIRLANGHVIAETNTGGGILLSNISSTTFNDGNYHVVRYTRTKDGVTLLVNNDLENFQGYRGGFSKILDRVHRVLIGGKTNANNQIVNGFNGIMGGVYYNGWRFMDTLRRGGTIFGVTPQIFKDVDITRTYILKKYVPPTPKPTAGPPPVYIPPDTKLPDDIGGSGISENPPSGGTGGGSPGVIGIGDAGGINTFPGSGIYVPGSPSVAAASSSLMGPAGPSAIGARAGVVVGTVLGTLAFLTSLMWALYKLKPGVPACLSPGAGAAGGGGGMSISAPRTTSNLAAVQAASAGGGAGSGGGAGAGAGKVTVVNGAAAGGGAGGGSSTYTSYFQSSSTAVGGGGAGAGTGADQIDSSTLRATGTFSNKGTSIGSPGAGRANMASSSSAYSANYQSNAANYQSNTLQSMQSYGSGQASPGAGGGMGSTSYSERRFMESTGGTDIPDYDLPVSGTLQSGHSYSSSTLNTHYNYQVQNLKTVTINRQGQYVMSGGAVTPGAAADEVRVDCCLITSDGCHVVTGSSLGPPQVWDMQSGELKNIMKGDTVGSTGLHLVCGDRLLVGAVHADMEINEYSGRKGVFNHHLQIWDYVSGSPLSMAEGEYCSALCPMSDNDKVMFARTDKFGDATSIIAWDLMGNQMIKEMRYDAPVGNNDYVSYLNKTKNDRYVVAGFTNSFDNFAEFMTFDMTLTSYIISEPAMLKLDANPDVTTILPKDEAVTGLRNGDLVVWNIKTAQPSRQLMGGGGAHAHSREVKCLSLSKDGRYLVSGSADGTLKVWDMHTERPVHTLNGHTDEVWCTSISDDNEIVVSGSSDGTIRLWRMKNGTEMCVFNCGVDIFFVTMSRDKGTIVALGDKFGARKLIMLQVVRTKIKKIVSS